MQHTKIETLIKPVIEDLGYQLWGLEYLSRGRQALLRIYINSPQGISLDDCTLVSRQVSATLDVEDPINVGYELEVSSPGLPRPLFYQWQYLENVGKLVDLKLFQPILKKRKIQGKIIGISDDALQIEYDNEQQHIPFTNITKAYLTLE